MARASSVARWFALDSMTANRRIAVTPRTANSRISVAKAAMILLRIERSWRRTDTAMASFPGGFPSSHPGMKVWCTQTRSGPESVQEDLARVEDPPRIQRLLHRTHH